MGVFLDLETQWRIGLAGKTGIDYAALPVVMDLYAIEQADRAQLFREIRVMEDAALDEIRKQRD